MEKSNTLNTLLEQVSQYHPLYNGGFASHIPMVMIALNRFNASSSKLQNTFDESIKDLELIGCLCNPPIFNISQN